MRSLVFGFSQKVDDLKTEEERLAGTRAALWVASLITSKADWKGNAQTALKEMLPSLARALKDKQAKNIQRLKETPPDTEHTRTSLLALKNKLETARSKTQELLGQNTASTTALQNLTEQAPRLAQRISTIRVEKTTAEKRTAAITEAKTTIQNMQTKLGTLASQLTNYQLSCFSKQVFFTDRRFGRWLTKQLIKLPYFAKRLVEDEEYTEMRELATTAKKALAATEASITNPQDISKEVEAIKAQINVIDDKLKARTTRNDELKTPEAEKRTKAEQTVKSLAQKIFARREQERGVITPETSHTPIPPVA